MVTADEKISVVFQTAGTYGSTMTRPGLQLEFSINHGHG